EMRARVDNMLRADEVRIAEHDGEAVGALALGPAPDYVPPSPVAELYVTLLVSARRLARNEVGARLLTAAVPLARQGSTGLLRVDCWADAPRLIRFYEREGFIRDGRFELDGWRGQILSKPV